METDLTELDDEQLLAKCQSLAAEQEAERQKLIGLTSKDFYAKDRGPFWDAHNRVVAAVKELRSRGLDL